MLTDDGEGEVCVDGKGAYLGVDQRDTDPIVAMELTDVLSEVVDFCVNSGDQWSGHVVILSGP